MTDTANKEMAGELESAMSGLRNPFMDFYFWTKGELYDLQAMQDALSGRDRLVEHKNKLEAKIKADNEAMQKLRDGKKTLKTLFKSQEGKQNEIHSLENQI